ncbi:ParA family protein [Tenacibaculum amylolyticum]|uniref:ParA family protein n=1 Tax=Tenacibaculum amylolyticum TaxID=104269 RepID=UPI0038967254
MGKIISICNQKGGVGKTTTCVNLSAALGILENKVLIIDTDPQANACMSFGFSSKKLNNPALQFMDFTSVITNNIIKTNCPNVDLVPFFEDLNFFKSSSKFKKALAIIRKSYDYIIIDSVPFLKAKNIDILVNSDAVIIPVQCDYYALEGLHKILKAIRFVQKKLNPNLSIEGFLLTMYDKRVNFSRNIVCYMRNHFNQLVFNTIIHRNSKITQAPSFGKSILEYDINCNGSVDYLQLANEIILKNATATEDIITLEEKESSFNDRKFTKTVNSETKNHSLYERILQKSKIDCRMEQPSFLKNFDDLLNLTKSSVKNIMGTGYKNHFGVWIYKINRANFFQKRYLYLYFKNDKVLYYNKKWFSH